ncbi:tyrosine-type recombinase/integrase [Intrasporangium sp.]|uniref:tyrosine-type recombinase/integrase n=1 Tax=Intrasporangium sp. TaxID=1925024 RepID=UPI0033656679
MPRILTPAEVDTLTGALRTHRDRAMVAAMLLGGLRRCEVLGLRLEDLRVAERRVFIAHGKGGHQRLVPISARFFEHVAAYLEQERPADADTDIVFPRAEAAPAGSAVERVRPSTSSSTAPADGPGWRTPPATSCGTPA